MMKKTLVLLVLVMLSVIGCDPVKEMQEKCANKQLHTIVQTNENCIPALDWRLDQVK
jgi:uncharacterized lipoprotein NlpE involved in copper resistance